MELNGTPTRWAIVVAAICCLWFASGPCSAWPLPEEIAHNSSAEVDGTNLEDADSALLATNSSQNGTKELYVIKAVVYEVGILADVPDNETQEDDEPITHQQVDLSFFSNGGNDTHINLSDIPVPIQTSVRGQVFTGIAPVHVGAVPTNLSDLLSALPISGTVVNISQTNSSYVEVHKHNVSDAAVLLSQQNGLASLPFSHSASEPLVPASVDETVIGLTNNNKSPKDEKDDKE